MSLLTNAKHKSPTLGYCPDFVQTLKPLLKEIKQKGIRVVSNAGGVNPTACTAALLDAACDQGVELSVATVTGDDFINKMEEVRLLGVREMATGQALPDSVHSMNAYLGRGTGSGSRCGGDWEVCGLCPHPRSPHPPVSMETG
jgi:hypothetical protein